MRSPSFANLQSLRKMCERLIATWSRRLEVSICAIAIGASAQRCFATRSANCCGMRWQRWRIAEARRCVALRLSLPIPSRGGLAHAAQIWRISEICWTGRCRRQDSGYQPWTMSAIVACANSVASDSLHDCGLQAIVATLNSVSRDAGRIDRMRRPADCAMMVAAIGESHRYRAEGTIWLSR